MCLIAFSSEVATGSRQENASRQQSRASSSRPGGRRAQYSARRKRQWPRSFPVLSSAGKPATIEKGLLLRRGRAAQNAIAMREAPEPADNAGVVLGIAEVIG